MADPPPVPGLAAGDRSRLSEVLHRSRTLGFLGPGPVADQIDRSVALVDLVVAAAGPRPSRSATSALDLGSGGGVPGLVLALALPGWEWTLLDGSRTRCSFLEEAVTELALRSRVTVAAQRAEEAGRGPLRGFYDLLVARGFAAPAPTAECAAPLLRVGGAAVITEPPGGAPERWPKEGLASLGMELGIASTAPVAAQVLRQVHPCPDRYPRRTGVPVKRPLWPGRQP
jgi:16S rRNA (guanine527-N7)-methyltransferase